MRPVDSTSHNSFHFDPDLFDSRLVNEDKSQSSQLERSSTDEPFEFNDYQVTLESSDATSSHFYPQCPNSHLLSSGSESSDLKKRKIENVTLDFEDDIRAALLENEESSTQRGDLKNNNISISDFAKLRDADAAVDINELHNNFDNLDNLLYMEAKEKGTVFAKTIDPNLSRGKLRRKIYDKVISEFKTLNHNARAKGDAASSITTEILQEQFGSGSKRGRPKGTGHLKNN